MLVHLKTSSRTQLPDGLRQKITILNRQLKAGFINLDQYEASARLMKAKVEPSAWPTFSNMLFVTV